MVLLAFADRSHALRGNAGLDALRPVFVLSRAAALILHVTLSPSRRAGGNAWPFPPAPLGHPGYAALRVHCVARSCGGGRRGAGRTRLFEPQTCCRPISCQPCATRPRKRRPGAVRWLCSMAVKVQFGHFSGVNYLGAVFALTPRSPVNWERSE